jgi:hypothetical protein
VSIELVNTLKHTLTLYELTEAISILCDERKDRQKGQLIEMKNTLIMGDRVEWYSSRHSQILYGKVTKTKTKKAIVHQEGTTMRWDIPMGMLKKTGSVND